MPNNTDPEPSKGCGEQDENNERNEPGGRSVTHGRAANEDLCTHSDGRANAQSVPSKTATP